MRPSGIRFMVAGGAIFLGACFIWLSAAVPLVQGAVGGSALSTAPDGLSEFGKLLRDRGVLAQSVRIDDTDEGIGLTPLPWDAWGLRPQDAVLTVRSDVSLTDSELATGKTWLEAGGNLVVVAESKEELQIPEQLLGHPVTHAKMFDGAFSTTPDHPLIPDGQLLYQLDEAMVVVGDATFLGSAGLSWQDTPTPQSADALQPWAFAATYSVGAGSILVIGDSHPITNAGLPEWDDHALAERIIDRLASGGGVVFVDEGHHGAGGPIRLDLALRALGPSGRTAIVGLIAIVLASFLFPWPSRVLAAVRRRVTRAPPPPPTEGPAALAARRPDWDPRLLDRLWSGEKP